PAGRAHAFCRLWEEWTIELVRHTSCGWMSDGYASVLAALALGLPTERSGYTMSSAWTRVRINPSVSVLHYAWPNEFFYKKHHLLPGAGPFRAADYPEAGYPEGSVGRLMCRALNEQARDRPRSWRPFA